MRADGDTTHFLGMWLGSYPHRSTVAGVPLGRSKIFKRGPVTNVPSKLRGHAAGLEPPRSAFVLPRTA